MNRQGAKPDAVFNQELRNPGKDCGVSREDLIWTPRAKLRIARMARKGGWDGGVWMCVRENRMNRANRLNRIYRLFRFYRFYRIGHECHTPVPHESDGTSRDGRYGTRRGRRVYYVSARAGRKACPILADCTGGTHAAHCRLWRQRARYGAGSGILEASSTLSSFLMSAMKDAGVASREAPSWPRRLVPSAPSRK